MDSRNFAKEYKGEYIYALHDDYDFFCGDDEVITTCTNNNPKVIKQLNMPHIPAKPHGYPLLSQNYVKCNQKLLCLYL